MEKSFCTANWTKSSCILDLLIYLFRLFFSVVQVTFVSGGRIFFYLVSCSEMVLTYGTPISQIFCFQLMTRRFQNRLREKKPELLLKLHCVCIYFYNTYSHSEQFHYNKETISSLQPWNEPLSGKSRTKCVIVSNDVCSCDATLRPFSTNEGIIPNKPKSVFGNIYQQHNTSKWLILHFHGTQSFSEKVKEITKIDWPFWKHRKMMIQRFSVIISYAQSHADVRRQPVAVVETPRGLCRSVLRCAVIGRDFESNAGGDFFWWGIHRSGKPRPPPPHLVCLHKGQSCWQVEVKRAADAGSQYAGHKGLPSLWGGALCGYLCSSQGGFKYSKSAPQ